MELLKAMSIFAILWGNGHGVATRSCDIRARDSMSSCSVGNGCLIDHPPEEELKECQENYPSPEESHAVLATRPAAGYIQECPKFQNHFTRCNEVVSHLPQENDFFKIGAYSQLCLPWTKKASLLMLCGTFLMPL